MYKRQPFQSAEELVPVEDVLRNEGDAGVLEGDEPVIAGERQLVEQQVSWLRPEATQKLRKAWLWD